MNRFYLLSTWLIFQILLFHNEANSNQNKNPNKIAIIGCHNPEYDHIGIYAHLNKFDYAIKHGYNVYLYTEYLTPKAVYWWPKTLVWWLGYWLKVVAMQKHLTDHDWLLYLDSDTLIMNDSIKLETLIDDRYDLIATADGGPTPILSGQFLLKNSEWSKQFLQRWLEIGNNNISPGFDGGALIQLFNEIPDIRKHVKILPIRQMGSYYWDYQEGDFAIQFAGLRHKDKAIYMKAYYERKLFLETK